MTRSAVATGFGRLKCSYLLSKIGDLIFKEHSSSFIFLGVMKLSNARRDVVVGGIFFSDSKTNGLVAKTLNISFSQHLHVACGECTGRSAQSIIVAFQTYTPVINIFVQPLTKLGELLKFVSTCKPLAHCCGEGGEVGELVHGQAGKEGREIGSLEKEQDNCLSV